MSSILLTARWPSTPPFCVAAFAILDEAPGIVMFDQVASRAYQYKDGKFKFVMSMPGLLSGFGIAQPNVFYMSTSASASPGSVTQPISNQQGTFFNGYLFFPDFIQFCLGGSWPAPKGMQIQSVTVSNGGFTLLLKDKKTGRSSIGTFDTRVAVKEFDLPGEYAYTSIAQADGSNHYILVATSNEKAPTLSLLDFHKEAPSPAVFWKVDLAPNLLCDSPVPGTLSMVCCFDGGNKVLFPMDSKAYLFSRSPKTQTWSKPEIVDLPGTR